MKIAENRLHFNDKKEMIALFSMLDRDPKIRKDFLRLSQLQSLCSLKDLMQLALTDQDELQEVCEECGEQSNTENRSKSCTVLNVYSTWIEATKISPLMFHKRGL